AIQGPMDKIEVVIEDDLMLEEAIRNKVDIIMFDNCSPEGIKAHIGKVPEAIRTEASGGITVYTLPAYAYSVVYYISVGSLFHHEQALDFSLKVVDCMFNPVETLQKRIPDYYIQATNEELGERIRKIKEEMGDRLFMPTHHYQKDEVAQFADVMGDSLQLARISRDNKNAEHIVFNGVHFMAETADILTDDDQTVYLPDLNAGCSMADMADIDQAVLGYE